jgi:hypothetical protein
MPGNLARIGSRPRLDLCAFSIQLKTNCWNVAEHREIAQRDTEFPITPEHRRLLPKGDWRTAGDSREPPSKKLPGPVAVGPARQVQRPARFRGCREIALRVNVRAEDRGQAASEGEAEGGAFHE